MVTRPRPLEPTGAHTEQQHGGLDGPQIARSLALHRIFTNVVAAEFSRGPPISRKYFHFYSRTINVDVVDLAAADDEVGKAQDL